MDDTEYRFRRWLADLISPRGKRERIALAETRAAEQKRARHLFHMLWSKAVGSSDYKKAEWTEFLSVLCSLSVKL